MKEAEYLQGFSQFIFRGAVKYLQKKKPLTKAEYERISDDAKSRAFTVAGYTSMEVIEEFYKSVVEAAEQGKSMQEFRGHMNDWLTEHGYDALNPWKAENIFRTNVQTAYNVGHYRSMMEVADTRPYWMYVAVGDEATRPEHAAMSGTVWRADDPIWDVWYPPNGYGCRCHVRSYTARQVQERGYRVQRDAPKSVDTQTGEIGLLSPDKGFAYNPAKQEWAPDTGRLSPAMRAAYRKTHAKE